MTTEQAKAHFVTVWHALADVVVLALWNVAGFSVALLTEPWLHLTHLIGSDALNRMARAGQVWWGAFGLAVVILALLYQPRWFGLVAVVMLVSARAYDFWHDTPRDYWFLIGQIVFFALAVRGTNRRAISYG